MYMQLVYPCHQKGKAALSHRWHAFLVIKPFFDEMEAERLSAGIEN